jgi:hypothetical protein
MKPPASVAAVATAATVEEFICCCCWCAACTIDKAVSYWLPWSAAAWSWWSAYMPDPLAPREEEKGVGAALEFHCGSGSYAVVYAGA